MPAEERGVSKSNQVGKGFQAEMTLVGLVGMDVPTV